MSDNLKVNTDKLYNSISSMIAELSIKTVKEFESDKHNDNPPDYIKVRRALGYAIKSRVSVIERDLTIDLISLRNLEASERKDFKKHLKKQAAMLMLADLYDQDLIQVEKINEWQNLGLPQEQYRLSLPVLNWKLNGERNE